MASSSSTSKATRPQRTPPPQGTVRERRRSQRIPSVTAGTVGDLPVQVFDVSLDGVGFQSTARLAADSTHPIVIGNGPMYLEGTIRIASVRPRGDGAYDIGATFV